MSDKFDVIINGSAVGEGTLARRLGPTGNRILILERVDWLKALNWDVKTVFADNRYISPTATRGHSNHKFIILSAAPQKCMARRSTAYARKASGNFREYGGISPARPISHKRLGALLYEGGANLSGARYSRRGPDRARGKLSILPSACT